MAGPLLHLADVVKRRVGPDQSFELAVDELHVSPGETLALVGPSGCGKSTLLDLLALALSPDSARTFVLRVNSAAPVDIAATWRTAPGRLARLRRAYYGYVVQTGGLLPFLTVWQNIALQQNLAGRLDWAFVDKLAAALGIREKLDDLPAALSVGQRQRAAIARALAHMPAIILADEPTAALDQANADRVMRLFLELVCSIGSALVLATHDLRLANAFGIPFVQARVEVKGPSSRTVFVRGWPG